MESIIKIDELIYKIKDKTILNNICLNIEQNSWITIVGPNGSGKSTLIKILAGLLPYNGYINIDNLVLDETNKKEIRIRIGTVLDNLDNQIIGETVEDDLAFPLENLNYNKEEIKKSITKISKFFQISHLLHQSANSITNSEKQIVSISSALITNPKILLLDDAIHQLDPNIKTKFLNNLKKYKKEHKLTIIMTTQNLEDTLYSDKIIILNNGQKVIEGTPLSVLKQDKLLKENFLTQPFIIELSQKLMMYNLIDHIYLDERKLVGDLWK